MKMRTRKKMLMALWRDPRTPRRARILLAVSVAYLLCPIDLVPDFIPVLGYLDDVVIVGMGLWMAWLLIPKALREEHREAALATETDTQA